jgi:glycosyltransferase involved in cell wall biosynthesis
MRRSYLLIPHAPATRLKTRADELAFGLAKNGHPVEIYQRKKMENGKSLAEKISWHAREALRGVRSEKLNENIHQVFPPTLHHTSPLQRKLDLFAAYLLQQRGNDVTVSSAFGGPSLPPLGKRGTFIYDYVDDHASGWRHAGEIRLANRVEKFVAKEIANADLVISSSLYLVNEAKEKFGRNSLYVPNGANVELIRSHERNRGGQEENSIRALYMGGLDYFVNLQWPLEAMEGLREQGVNLEFWIVGDGPAIKNRTFPHWVKILGFQKPEKIPEILSQVDIGILPFLLNPFTDAALPLKILEYGAARLPTVSSPLSELKFQKFPWVRFADGDSKSWELELGHACEMIKEKVWQSDWDPIVENFSWQKIAANLDQALP